MRERVRTAHWRDAALIATIADPAALFIKAPCKVTAPPCDALFIEILFRPFVAPCYKLHEPRHCRLARRSFDDRIRIFQSSRATAFGCPAKPAGAHLTDEACAERGVWCRE
jgi:hypothetical protein